MGHHWGAGRWSVWESVQGELMCYTSAFSNPFLKTRPVSCYCCMQIIIHENDSSVLVQATSSRPFRPPVSEISSACYDSFHTVYCRPTLTITCLLKIFLLKKYIDI